MANDANFDIKLLLDFKEAINGVKQFSEQTAQATKSVTETFEKMGTAIEGAVAAFAVEKIVEGLKYVIEAGAEADKTLQDMRQSLKTAGAYSVGAAADFEDFAKGLASTSTNSQDAILSQVRLGKQFNLSNDGVKRLISASIELAAATGIDLNTATEQLGKTLDGSAGKLARVIPSLQGISAEALKSGAAFEIVEARFRGTAEAATNTFTGAMIQSQNAVHDLVESIGKLIVQNPAVISTLKSITDAANAFGEQFGSASDQAHYKIAQLQKDIAFFETQVKTLGTENFMGAQAQKNLDDAKLKISLLEEEMRKFEGSTAAAARALADKSVFTPDAGALAAFQALYKSVVDIGLDAQETLQNKYYSDLAVIRDAYNKAHIGEIEFEDSLYKLRLKHEQDLADLKKKQDAEADAKLRKAQEKEKKFQEDLKHFLGSPLKDLFGDGKKVYDGNLTDDTRKGLTRGIGGLDAILGGANGAKSVIGTLGDGLASYLNLGIPGVGGLAQLLAQGPEQVKKSIDEFADALPGLIENIVKSIPILIEEIADKMPEIIQRLVDDAPQIIQSLIENSPKLMLAMAGASPKVIAAMIQDAPKVIGRMIAGIPEFIAKLVGGAGQFIGHILDGALKFNEKIIEGAGRFVQELLNKITGVGGKGGLGSGNLGGGLIGGGVGSIIGGPIGGIIGAVGGIHLAKGGQVPSGFNGDNFPAQLSSGENVIDRSLSQKLAAFLDSPIEVRQPVQLVIGTKILAEGMLEVSRRGIRAGFQPA